MLNSSLPPKPTHVTTTKPEGCPPSIQTLRLGECKGNQLPIDWNKSIYLEARFLRGKKGLEMARFIKNSQDDLMRCRSILINLLGGFEEIAGVCGDGSCDWHLSLARESRTVSSPWGSQEPLEGLGNQWESLGRERRSTRTPHSVRGCPGILHEAPRGGEEQFTAPSAHSLQGNLMDLSSGHTLVV